MKTHAEMLDKTVQLMDYLTMLAVPLVQKGAAMPDFQTQYDSVSTALSQIATAIQSATSITQVTPPTNISVSDNLASSESTT